MGWISIDKVSGKLAALLSVKNCDQQYNSSRWAVTSGTSQISTQGPMLFNVFINNPDDGMEHTCSKFTDDTKFGEEVDKLGGAGGGRAAI